VTAAEGLTVTDRDAVRWIELDRPASKNGVTPDTMRAIAAAVTEAPPATRAIALAGKGGSFSSGLDLKDAMQRGLRSSDEVERDLRDHFHGAIRALVTSSRPTVAIVDGAAAGFGCDLALACDVRVISPRARFGEIFVKRGLIPDGGGTWLLPRIVGLGRALELLMTGEVIDANEAYRIGLANRLYPEDQFAAASTAYVEALAKGPPLVHRLIKRLVYAGLSGDLAAALDREAVGQMQCLASKDFAEGVAAFLGKRDPNFTGQ
jgi:2-(1,2-epoxy-1,2-dihydrophenyl)acetyl-CoA isomerase